MGRQLNNTETNVLNKKINYIVELVLNFGYQSKDELVYYHFFVYVVI